MERVPFARPCDAIHDQGLGEPGNLPVRIDPGAVLVIEVRLESRAQIEAAMNTMEAEMRAAGLGYAFPVLWGDDSAKVWELRRAGQGVMSNVPGDRRYAKSHEWLKLESDGTATIGSTAPLLT